MDEATVTATVTDPELNENKIVILAREVAWRVFPIERILSSAGITQEQFDRFILPNALFRRAKEAFLIEWESATSTQKRIAAKSAAMLEENLPEIGLRMTNKDEPLNHAVEAAKLVARLAGMEGDKMQGPATGEKFTININLGNKKIEQVIDAGELKAIPAKVDDGL